MKTYQESSAHADPGRGAKGDEDPLNVFRYDF